MSVTLNYQRHKLSTLIAIQLLNVSLNVSDVVTLSSEGSTLRAWNLPDGQMVWESSLQGTKPSKSLLSVPVSIYILSLMIVVKLPCILNNLIYSS